MVLTKIDDGADDGEDGGDDDDGDCDCDDDDDDDEDDDDDDDDDDGDCDCDDDDDDEEEEEEDRSQDREAHFVRACAGDMRIDISQESCWNEICRKNGRGHLWGHRFVRACAVESHMDISLQRALPIPPRLALTLTARTLQCGHTVWGIYAFLVRFRPSRSHLQNLQILNAHTCNIICAQCPLTPIHAMMHNARNGCWWDLCSTVEGSWHSLSHAQVRKMVEIAQKRATTVEAPKDVVIIPGQSDSNGKAHVQETNMARER